MKRWLLGASLVAVLVAQPALGYSTTLDLVIAGMKCTQNSMGSMECNYRVGRSLHFAIAGVGDADAAITFFASSFEGDYYATVGVLHGCVIVKSGKAAPAGVSVLDFAFVSPRTGKVYADWTECWEQGEGRN